MAKRVSIFVAAVALLLGVTCCGIPYCFYRYNFELPIHSFQRLVTKDDQITVVSIVIHGQGQVVILDDSESAAYLTAAFREASYEGYTSRHAGITYTIDLRFSTGGSISLESTVSSASGGFEVGYLESSFGDVIHYWIPLKKPLPETLATAFRQLEPSGPRP